MLHPSCSAKSLNRSPKISALEGMARSEMWLDSEGIRTKEGAHRWVVQYGSRIPVVPVDVRRTILQDFRNRASCTSLKTCTNWSAKPWISCWVCPHMRCWTLKLICVCTQRTPACRPPPTGRARRPLRDRFVFVLLCFLFLPYIFKPGLHTFKSRFKVYHIQKQL